MRGLLVWATASPLRPGIPTAVQHRREDRGRDPQRPRDRQRTDREHAALGRILSDQQIAELIPYLKTLK
jgi:hypothetical protein